MIFSNKQLLGVLGVGLAAVALSAKAATVAADKAGEAVNPLSTDNLIYKGVNRTLEVISGNGDNRTLGQRIYDYRFGGGLPESSSFIKSRN